MYTGNDYNWMQMFELALDGLVKTIARLGQRAKHERQSQCDASESVKCVYTDNIMTITEEGSILLDDCPPVMTITQTVSCGLHISLARYASID